MSIWLTAKECVSLPGLPLMEHNIRNRLDKASGESLNLRRRRPGSKAFEYHVDCLPEKAREIVKQRHYNAVLEQTDCRTLVLPERKSTVVKVDAELEVLRKCPALLERKLAALTDKQKRIADARMTLVLEVRKLMEVGNMKRKPAVELVASRSREGTLSDYAQQAAEVAKASKRERGVGVRVLQAWLSCYLATDNPGERLAMMAPGKIKAKPVEAYPWLADFLRFYQKPSRPSVAMAYEDFVEGWQSLHGSNAIMMALLPSLDTVRFVLKKIPKAERERGRVSGAEYKSLLPFVRRDWSVLPVNGAWIGDGHGMKMEVLHPDTGLPFKPELTLVIEGPTRVCVGWSLALSENQVAVGDAIRHGISLFGVPLIYYSDNGGGEKNKTFDADITGIFSRLEIDHQTGIPGNPQARGIIERINREIPMRAAKTFGSYVGKSGDRETQRVYRKKVDSAFNAISQGKPLSAEQAAFARKVPAWDELLAEIDVQVQRHNNRPHDSLPKRESGQHWSPLAYRNHLIKQDKVELDFLSSAELHEMFRPEVVRKAVRGEVRVFNNLYFSAELIKVEGEKVRVCFDIHDPHSVIIRRMDGSWVCDAIWDGNKVDAFPKAYVDTLKEKRVKGRRDRAEKKLREIEAENTPVIEHQPQENITVLRSGVLIPEPEPAVYTSAAERLRAMNER